MGSIGALEIGIVAAILLIIFGPSQIPKLGRSIGQSIREFRNVGKEITRGLDVDDDDKGA
jgi:sec-independent protein translocase protein TatA